MSKILTVVGGVVAVIAVVIAILLWSNESKEPKAPNVAEKEMAEVRKNIEFLGDRDLLVRRDATLELEQKESVLIEVVIEDYLSSTDSAKRQVGEDLLVRFGHQETVNAMRSLAGDPGLKASASNVLTRMSHKNAENAVVLAKEVAEAADVAKRTAETAIAKADNAVTNATTAITSVTNAVATANSAVAKVDVAIAKVTAVEEAVKALTLRANTVEADLRVLNTQKAEMEKQAMSLREELLLARKASNDASTSASARLSALDTEVELIKRNRATITELKKIGQRISDMEAERQAAKNAAAVRRCSDGVCEYYNGTYWYRRGIFGRWVVVK